VTDTHEARQPAVVSRGLKKSFGNVHAVAGIDLDVPGGACFGLIGENGAGKTTFIKMLLGITRPDDGEVKVLGGSPEDVSVRKKIGYLPERLAMPEAFSPLRFLASVGRLKGLLPTEIKVETERVLEQVQLDRAAWKRNTGGFSKGMKQRTGLAAALIGKPRLLVLDEPTDGIDPLGRAQIRDVIVDAVRGGSTVFLNSHLLAETEKICDHVAVLSRGRVVQAGALDVLKRKDASRIRLLKAESDVARAEKHGFKHMKDLDGDAESEHRTYRWANGGAHELSKALLAVLADGLVVVEVAPELKDLETILRESIGKPSMPAPPAPPSTPAAPAAQGGAA
jgi:ABC-2 type transport system ATP-binding protein